MTFSRIVNVFVSLVVVSAISGCGTKPNPVEIFENPPAKSASILSTFPIIEKLANPPGDDEFDQETVLATRSLSENCTICHASDIIQSQRLTAKQWKAEVEKMIGWGSPLPAEQQEGLTQYLSKTYPETLGLRPIETLTAVSALLTILPDPASNNLVSGDPLKGEAAFAASCKNCHGQNGEGSLLGPNLVERPVLTRAHDFEQIINKGQGRMPMLGPLVDKTAKQDILAWLRAKRYTQLFPSKS